jgi:hypothetical protein
VNFWNEREFIFRVLLAVESGLAPLSWSIVVQCKRCRGRVLRQKRPCLAFIDQCAARAPVPEIENRDRPADQHAILRNLD